MKCLKFLLIALFLFAVFVLGVWSSVAFRKPSLHRDWAKDQLQQPVVSIDGQMVRIEGVRNIEYKTKNDFEVKFDTRTYDLRKMDSVWFVLEHFEGDWKGPAHTFVSFGFDDGTFVSVSVEIRKEVGEEYSALKGFFRNYELVYVIADERDVIGLRTNYRKDDVYLYPIQTTKDLMRKMFVEMVLRADQLGKKPEFYHTFFSSCTTNIVKHINNLVPGKVRPLSKRVLLPGYSDFYAYDLGLIDTDLPKDKIRQAFYITDFAQQKGITYNFSRDLRTFLKEK